ncbi:hypothetical protein JI739_23730 [Ramlibacter sp. AW1]|uniref:Uncharacterized protein n=1 Tax=Ramlibacter aurantiacus TaxID=2801330 RepID=A0A937D8S7_9BURK|nr:hypothetical protein [Ramlibacter aurantiacus]MBL0423368.1 hypothetical protein [Ramlibacter aurantiacus]
MLLSLLIPILLVPCLAAVLLSGLVPFDRALMLLCALQVGLFVVLACVMARQKKELERLEHWATPFRPPLGRRAGAVLLPARRGRSRLP